MKLRTMMGTLIFAIAALPMAAAAAPISFSGVDAQSQYTGFTGPPGPDAPGVLTFWDTLNGANPSPEGGTVTGHNGLAGVLGGVIDFQAQLDTSGYNPATDTLLSATFIGTGGNEVLIWDATLTTVLLAFDLSFLNAKNANGIGTVNNLVQLGDPEGSTSAIDSLLTVTGGSLAGSVGGIGTQAVMDIIINDPNPALPDDFGSFVAQYPGFWNDSFSSGAPAPNPDAGINWSITIIPEPGTGSLVAAALLGLAAQRRSRRLHRS